LKPGDSPISIAEKPPLSLKRTGFATNRQATVSKRGIKKKELTLVEQPAAYGQHLHEGPQLLVLREKLGQVLAAEEASKQGRYRQHSAPNQSIAGEKGRKRGNGAIVGSRVGRK
jgi:D-serine deaminase-like pyridoxal phosphate-dependent protein